MCGFIRKVRHTRGIITTTEAWGLTTPKKLCPWWPWPWCHCCFGLSWWGLVVVVVVVVAPHHHCQTLALTWLSWGTGSPSTGSHTSSKKSLKIEQSIKSLAKVKYEQGKVKLCEDKLRSLTTCFMPCLHEVQDNAIPSISWPDIRHVLADRFKRPWVHWLNQDAQV